MRQQETDSPASQDYLVMDDEADFYPFPLLLLVSVLMAGKQQTSRGNPFAGFRLPYPREDAGDCYPEHSRSFCTPCVCDSHRNGADRWSVHDNEIDKQLIIWGKVSTCTQTSNSL